MAALKNLKKYFPSLLLCLFLLPVIFSLLRPGFFVSDDGDWMIIRFSAFHQEFAAGQIPVRFLNRLNNGYGYPVANFLYPGFMYLAEVPKILGFSFVGAIKTVLVLSIFSAGIFTFLWLKAYFKNTKAAFLGALTYLYNPYLLWDIYKRGSVGEIFFLGLLPLAFWAIEKQYYWLVAMTYAALLLAHNTLALLLVPVVICYQLLTCRKFWPVVVGFGLAAFFWLPAVLELTYTNFGEINISNFTEYFISGRNLALIGWSNLIFFVSGLVFISRSGRKLPIKLLLFFAIFAGGLFFALPLSNFFWQNLPLLPKLSQFPFRFLSLTLVGGTFLTAFLAAKAGKHLQPFLTILPILLLVLALPFITPATRTFHADSYYSTNEGTTTVADEYLPSWVKERSAQHAAAALEIIPEKGVARLNTVYWPGWQVFVNGQKRPVNFSNAFGLIEFDYQIGQGQIDAKFSETPFRLIANLTSLFSVLVLFFYAKKTVKD